MFLLVWLFIFIGIPALIVLGIIKMFKFVTAPIGEVETDEDNTMDNSINKDEILKVAIKNNNMDTSRIVEYNGEEVASFEFRPQTWTQFIAQDEAKERVKTIIKKAERGIRSHLILSAIKGHGKTTFIELLAKDMNAHLIKRIGKQIDEDNLVDIINEINTSEKKHVIFFVDEIDSMDWKVIKILNPIIEQFEIDGKKIKPFTFACATINKHILVKQNPDTLDRIPHHIQFKRYTAEDIGKIIIQYKNQLYKDEMVAIDILNSISKNCKFNPRTAIALLEDYVVERDINKVLRNCNIVKHGLNNIDVSILRVLNESKRAMGANALAMRIGLGQSQYTSEYEPFLVEFGFVARTPSRIITEKGKTFLKELK